MMILKSLFFFLFISSLKSSPLIEPTENNDDDDEFSLEVISALSNVDEQETPEKVQLFGGLCSRWNKKQPSDEKIKEIVNSLPPCRPNAPLDAKGKFPDGFDSFSVDDGCNPNGNFIERGCLFHPGAKACYRSTPLNGHDQQCCYSNDGKLLVGPPGGGTLDMSTGIMHVFDDVLPYLVCCRFSKRCDLYYQKRPSDDGSRWHP